MTLKGKPSFPTTSRDTIKQSATGRRRHPQWLREEALRIARTQGYSASRVAQELAVPRATVARWIRSAEVRRRRNGSAFQGTKEPRTERQQKNSVVEARRQRARRSSHVIGTETQQTDYSIHGYSTAAVRQQPQNRLITQVVRSLSSWAVAAIIATAGALASEWRIGNSEGRTESPPGPNFSYSTSSAGSLPATSTASQASRESTPSYTVQSLFSVPESTASQHVEAASADRSTGSEATSSSESTTPTDLETVLGKLVRDVHGSQSDSPAVPEQPTGHSYISSGSLVLGAAQAPTASASTDSWANPSESAASNDLDALLRSVSRNVNDSQAEWQSHFNWGSVLPRSTDTGRTGGFFGSRTDFWRATSFGWCAENGSCYGDLSVLTGRPKTVYIRGYLRSDGTYVRSHFRSRPSR
jgi:transposase-like protein